MRSRAPTPPQIFRLDFASADHDLKLAGGAVQAPERFARLCWGPPTPGSKDYSVSLPAAECGGGGGQPAGPARSTADPGCSGADLMLSQPSCVEHRTTHSLPLQPPASSSSSHTAAAAALRCVVPARSTA